MSLLWINGALVDKSEARVSPVDHGFLYGDGVWEPLRVAGGRLLLADEHLDCLFRSAASLGLAIPLTRAELRHAIETTLAANARTEGYVRAIVTRGPGTIGPDPRKLDPQVVVIAEEYQPFPRELTASGLHAVVSPVPVETDSPLFPARTLGQLHVPLARRFALGHGCLEAIFQDRAGNLIGTTEGILFAVKSGDVTVASPHPPEATGERIAALAASSGRAVREGPLRLEEALAADEVFLAGTAAGVIAIVRIDGTTVGTGTEGPVTRSLRESQLSASGAA